MSFQALTKGTCAVAALCFGCAAQAGLIQVGSSFTFGGTNDPDTFSDTVTFSSTPVLVDNGKVRIWETQTPTAGGGEWDVFNMVTVNGGPLAGNINSFWNIVIAYNLSQPVFFNAAARQWLVNGTPVSPISNFGGICCATNSNPILPGAAYYSSGFSAQLPAGVESNWQEIFVSPYSFISSGGMDPNTANGYTFAYHFDPLTPTPEPAVTLLIGSGLAAFVFIRRRYRTA